MKIKLLVFRIFLPLILAALASPVHGQNIQHYNSFHYNVNEGLLQSTMIDMAFDKNNFCWLSFPNGIQKFDGENFMSVPVQPGLSDDKMVFFFQCGNGDLLISHTQGISKYEISSNRFRQVYNARRGSKTPAQFLGEDDNLIYIYTESGYITGIDSRNFGIVKDIRIPVPEYYDKSGYRLQFSTNICNHKIAFLVKSTLHLWDLRGAKIISSSSPISNISGFAFILNNENEVRYHLYTRGNSLQQYNFAKKSIVSLPIAGLDSQYMSRCMTFKWQTKTLFAVGNRLYETDSSCSNILTELVNFQNQPIAGSASIARIKEDNFGNLLIATVTGGLKKVIRNNYLIKYYGSENKDDNFVLSILPDKVNNRILVGSIGGLLVFDTLQHLIKQFRTLPGQKTSFAPNAIIKNTRGEYLLFNSGEKNIWVLNQDLSKMHSYSIQSQKPNVVPGLGYFGNFLFQNDNRSITQSQGRLYKTNLTNYSTKEHEFTTTYTMSGLLYKDVIISHGNDELIFMDTASFKETKRIPFKNTGYVRCFVQDADQNIFIGCNKGIFKIDSTGKILLHLNKQTGLPDECIYAMTFDNNGTLWCSTNKGILNIHKDNSILQLKKEDGLQENEFNTNVVARTDDGELFFGGVNGVSSFFPAAIQSQKENINLIFTGIRINNEDLFTDTAVWNVDEIELNYDQNSLSFDFIGMANNNPGQYIYQYKMEPINTEWTQNNDLQTVHYYLQPGKYVFKIYASRIFNKDAESMKEVHIWIHPPFWKTWWFNLIIALVCIAILAYSIYNVINSRYRKKLRNLEGENRIQLERERISRDLHDNIGAYANTVLYKTDLLQNESKLGERNELMNDLKFASKDIITSLRETIWALKKEVYSAQDCLFRIRNFIQPFTRYYPDIQLSVKGEAPPAMTLHYTRALNLVRVVQEAVSNSLKHSGATMITINSYPEKEKWKITVEDNGAGFDFAGIDDLQQGNGLNNMKQRAQDGSFKLTVDSKPGEGTVVSIFL